jgi:hypothetical protein
MSEETGAEVTAAVQDREDWFLRILVKMVETGIEFGLTLQMGGLLVSGIVTTRRTYFAGFIDAFASGPEDPEVGQGLREGLAPLLEDVSRKPVDGEDAPEPIYIHMRQAQFFGTAGTPVPSQGVWWRGRISEIDGFILGTLSVP